MNDTIWHQQNMRNYNPPNDAFINTGHPSINPAITHASIPMADLIKGYQENVEAKDTEIGYPGKITRVKKGEIPNYTPLYDAVTRPEHYNRKGIECLDAIEASMEAIEFQGYLKGNFEKYVWRFRYKNKPLEDLKKASFYLNRLIIEIENEEKNREKSHQEAVKADKDWR